MKIERSSGVLMHITSLPGNYGIGSLGPEAYHFADMLRHAGQTYWQILPFNPVNHMFGYSPYISPSTYAGNPLFISLEKLREKNWIPNELIPESPFDPYSHYVDFDGVRQLSENTLKTVFKHFQKAKPEGEIQGFNNYCKENSEWLDDYSLFISLVNHFDTYLWTDWDSDIANRKPEAIKKWSETLQDDVIYNKFLQYLFYCQWAEWKYSCNQKGLKIVGDIPIYVNFDSCDAWVNPGIFQLDDELKPTVVAGVPPDYFSATGQRWGNPIYKWFDPKGKLNNDTMNWWIKRIKHVHKFVDIVRIDHFRALESYWSIPSQEETALNGQWVKGPGGEFFNRISEALGELPLIAEDLGVVTPEVEKLRDDFDLPGMKILQFAFDYSNNNQYLPHSINNHNCILYTGTHDNNTSNGWYYNLDEASKNFIKKYMNIENDSDFHWHFIHLAYQSMANLVILPTQDILGYDSSFKMNQPGAAVGNWAWKLTPGALNDWHLNRLKDLCWLFNRAK